MESRGPKVGQFEYPSGNVGDVCKNPQRSEQSRDAQDDGLFSDEAGAAAWLHANRNAVVAGALRRLDEFEAAGEKSKATGAAP